jgi:hypothetical protein
MVKLVGARSSYRTYEQVEVPASTAESTTDTTSSTSLLAVALVPAARCYYSYIALLLPRQAVTASQDLYYGFARLLQLQNADS